MPSMKAIKRRITSVNNTKQIMKAMNLVAASKLQKSKARMAAVQPLFEETQHFLENGIRHEDAAENIYFRASDGKRAAYVVITGDRGLCGGYNANMTKEAFNHMNTGKHEKIIPVGIKGRDYFIRRKKNVLGLGTFIEASKLKAYMGVTEGVPFGFAEDVGTFVHGLYTAEKEEERVDEVYVAYTRFESILSHIPCVEKILPLSLPSAEKAAQAVLYEPDVDTYLKKAMPIYVTMFIYGAMVESAVCEQAARMTSMDAATRNADEIIEDLKLEFNRKRQSVITQEINEIVSGANAM